MDKLQQAAYRSLQDMDRRGMFTTDAHLHLSSWNRWLEEHSGLSRADVLGRPLLKLFPKSAARLEPLYRQALEDQVVVISPRLHRYLLPLSTGDGQKGNYMQQSARILPLHGDGGVIGTLTLIEDVSERFLREGELRQHIDRLQDTEKALRRQERQFRALVEANQDLVMALEDNGDIRYLSPSVVSLLGDQAKLHIARRLPGLIHPQDRFAVIKIFREVRHAANLAQAREFRLRGQEGDWRMIEATFQNLAGHAEDAGIAVYGRDITARRQAEAELKGVEREKAIILSTINDVIVFQDVDRRIIWANRAAAATVDLTPEEMVGRLCSEVCCQEPGACENCPVVLAQETGAPQEGEVTYPNGRTLLVRGYPVRAPQGGLDGMVKVATDITARRQAEESLRDAQAILSIRNQVAEVFLTVPDDEMYAGVLAIILKAMNSEYGVFGFLDEKGGLVVPSMTRTIWHKCQVADKRLTFPRETWGNSSWPRAIREKQTICLNGPSTLTPEGHVPVTRHISLPIIHQNEVKGLIQVANKETDYTAEDIALLETIGGAIAPVLDARLKGERQKAARQQAEEALTLREAKLTSIFRAAPVGIGLVKNRVLTEVNEQICHLTGYSREELLGQSARLVYTSQEEFEGVGREKYRQIQETGMGTVETRWRRKDGTIIDVMLSSTPLVPGDLAGDITFTALNITQLKRAMEELQLKERLLDGASDSIFLHDLEGHFLYLNQAAYRERGYEKEELLATDLTALITPEFARMRESFLTDLVARGEIIFESAHRRKDGSVMPVEIHARTIDLRDQQLILSAARDITERKQGEQKIKELNVLLKAIKEINEALLRVKSEPDLFQQTCDLLMQAPNIRFAWIGLVQPGSFEIKPVAWAGYEAGYLSDLRVTWDDSLQGGGAIGNAIRTGQPGVIEDIAGDPRALPWREAALKRGYSYMLALPLVHEDQTMGTLNVYSEKPKVFREDEIEFLQQVAGDIAVGIKSLRLAQGLEHSVKQLQVLMQQTVEAITFLAEIRDPYTAGHQQNVTRLALALAGELGLDEARREGLRVAGFLHDIGKIAVPAEILSKPGKLSKMEFTIIKNHSQAGYDILEKIEFPWPVAQIVLQHHERLDGSGYPQGLAGQDILLEARIMAVADVVEAMASHRPYRPALGIDQALEEIARNKGVLYDPEAVDACIELFTENKFTLE